MEKLDPIQIDLLEAISGLHEIPEGAYNIRENGKAVGRNTTANIDIVSRKDGSGIDVHVKPGTKNESVHIPVILSQTGFTELVNKTNVPVVAASQHDGIHRFFIGKNARVKYVEKHYGSGDGKGEKIMNPLTEIEIDENGYMEMDTAQIKGVDSTIRKTNAKLAAGASLVVMERLMTHGTQRAESYFDVQINGADASADVVSRSVAKDDSYQLFSSNLAGNAKCSGHTECDAIIVGNAKISAIPELTANDSDAALIHEAAIGKIAGDQIIKLMTLGLTEEEAEEEIIRGFLK